MEIDRTEQSGLVITFVPIVERQVRMVAGIPRSRMRTAGMQRIKRQEIGREVEELARVYAPPVGAFSLTTRRPTLVEAPKGGPRKVVLAAAKCRETP